MLFESENCSLSEHERRKFYEIPGISNLSIHLYVCNRDAGRQGPRKGKW